MDFYETTFNVCCVIGRWLNRKRNDTNMHTHSLTHTNWIERKEKKK